MVPYATCLFLPQIVRQPIELEPSGERMLRHSGGAFKMAWLGGEKARGGPYGPP